MVRTRSYEKKPEKSYCNGLEYYQEIYVKIGFNVIEIMLLLMSYISEI